MKLNNKYKAVLYSLSGFLIAATFSNASLSNKSFVSYNNAANNLNFSVDSPDVDLPYPLPQDQPGNKPTEKGRIDLKDPKNIDTEVVYNPETKRYEFKRKVGERDYRRPEDMSLEEYLDYDINQSMQNYWKEKIANETLEQKGGFKPELKIPGQAFDRIFGGDKIEIRPQGSAELIFGVNSSKTENPQLPVNQQKVTNFEFDQKIQLSVIGNIGDKVKLGITYNTEATFDFENETKLGYTGGEDEIIKLVELGNVSLPLQSQLITGSQSLFGIKTKLQFGRSTITAVFSQQKGERKEVEVKGGAQTNDFSISADNYEANRHYFLSNEFRNRYDDAMSTLPYVGSEINVSAVEVWVTNTSNNFQETRNFVSFTDLGEDGDYVSENPPQMLFDGQGKLPDNAQNNLYSLMNNGSIRSFSGATSYLQSRGYQPAVHYEKVESARKLNENEFTYNPLLGFISLNRALNNDEVLAVSYQYTFRGETYQVGDFSNDGAAGTDALILKLIKPTITNVRLPIWDLMMKNVYNIGAFQVNQENFRLEILYNNPQTGVDINYVPLSPIDGQQLIQVLKLDRLDGNGKPTTTVPGDGIFDYIDNAATQGGTINARNGRVFFPVVEPFGSHLKKQLAGQPEVVLNNLIYQALYDSTKTAAQQIPELNRFKIVGTYQSSGSSDISLNAINVPRGSVTVTAGGVKLQEGSDYTVDYTLGRVKIINQGLLESQTPIKVSLESQSLFSIQTKTLAGVRYDYRVNKNFNLGATVMNLSERPLTQKVSIGNEPINNTMLGFDGSFSTESGFITRLVDRLPFYETKEKSNVNFYGEFAQLIPGSSRAIGKNGVSYIDDFEGSQSTIDLKAFNTWVMASTPQGQPDLFPEGDRKNDLSYGFKRSKMAWHIVDPLFYDNNSATPGHIKDDPELQSNHLTRRIKEQEVFPNRAIVQGTLPFIPVFDVVHYPKARGPYNFTTALNNDGSLLNPRDNWSGIMRRVTTTDFESANIEFIQIWIQDPFNEDSQNQTGGDLYFNLGSVSEDILSDSRKAFENGLPKDQSVGDAGFYDPSVVDTTVWGRVPITQSIVNAFDNDPQTRSFQDVGLDGLNDVAERSFFRSYINQLDLLLSNGQISQTAYNSLVADPSADNYHFYRGDDFDNSAASILDRYFNYNGLEGNSATSTQSQSINSDGYPTSASTLPNQEDINFDNNLSETEAYFQYRVSLRPEDLVVGRNFVTDKLETTVETPDGRVRPITWYQLKIPVKEPDKVINGITDFRSIRFMRMFMRGFNEPVVARFARLEFIRGEWRRYTETLREDGETQGTLPGNTDFNISAVSVEENASREPVNYVIPPGIIRQNAANPQQTLLNEQALVLEACNLEDGDARAGYKNVNFDIRSYKKLQMFVHAESVPGQAELSYGDLSVFIRLGGDFNQNYYEYEIPVEITPAGSSNANDIWPDANNMELLFQKLLDVKKNRNSAVTTGDHLFIRPFVEMFENARITVKGNPNLAELKTVMIGVRNPDKKSNPWAQDNGMPICFETWVNELRLTDFEDDPGNAAIVRMDATLADLGTFSAAANYSTPGFGSIEKKVSERQRETINGIDLASNINLDKFFPENFGLRIPMYLGYSEEVSTPQFDPLNPDILIGESLNELNPELKKERLSDARSVLKRRSINFTNVRKEAAKGKTKNHFYDISNFSFNYGYNEQFMKSITVEYDIRKTYKGGFVYSFNNKPKSIEPFKNIAFFNKKYLKLLKDVNFYLAPKSFSFATNLERTYNEAQLRPITEGSITFAQVNKTFNWFRAYDLKYDITKALRFDYSANNRALIGEPEGRIDRTDAEAYQAYKDSIMSNINRGGETTNFTQDINLTYTLPFSKIPITEFLDVNVSYAGSFEWQRAPFGFDSLGHTIQNSRSLSLNGRATLDKLYNKIPYLKRVNDKTRRISRLSRSRGKVINSRIRPSLNPNQKPEEKEEEKEKDKLSAFESVARVLMMFKNLTATYSQTEGTYLPGFDRRPKYVGMEQGFGAPGAGFVFGGQDPEFARTAADNDWLVKTPSLNDQHLNTRMDQLNLKATIEPINDLRVELNATRNRSTNKSEFFRWNNDTSMYVSDNPLEGGSFSASISTWSTAFLKDNDENISEAFETFLDNRLIISQQLGSNDKYNDEIDTLGGYTNGYGQTSQQVLMPAFLAAYRGKDINNAELNPLATNPIPNWRISYSGLSKLPFFKKYFKTVTLNHNYRSNFSFNYSTDLQYNPNEDIRDLAGNFLPEKQITSFSIAEQFSPLINVDVTWQSGWITKLELKKDRMLNFSLANNQLTEVRGNEVVIGSGYRLKNFQLPFKVGNKDIKSDLNLRADVGIRSNKTVIRKVVERQNQLTSGQQLISIKVSADYVLSKSLSARLFFDRTINNPFISTSFPTANTSAGVSLRFTLTQ